MALIDLVEAKVKDDSQRLTVEDDFTPAVTAALERYSAHRPKEIVKDVAGAGTRDVALPAEWVAEFSELRDVEYPVDQDPEEHLHAGEYKIYQAPAGPLLRLRHETPAATETLRLTITVPRAEGDIVSGDLDAVACLAASFCCDTLANMFAATDDPTIAADVVNYRSKSADYTRRAKELRRRYEDCLGIDAKGGAPASMTVARPSGPGFGLTHWRHR